MTSELARLLAASPSLRSRESDFARAAAAEAPILLLGEPGTGRTALARALHAVGARAAGPLVEVDAATVPAALFESELFGHRPGAFTGADRAHLGRVERAAGGTLLLDYGDFLVHVFLDERRRFYGLERLWSDAPDVTPDFLPAS